jgi:NAD(P)-dependent dehydrogenase (short-subunit alcohol dehydrogenase family)
MDMKLTGKVALVTGAGQGIGRGIAEVFAREGADVVINDISTGERTDEVAAAIRGMGRRAIVVKADVSKRADVDRMFEEAQALGPIDILVNNAGIETIVPFLELTDEQWEDVTNVNLKSGWMCAQAFCKRAIQDGRTGGAIVNIGSIQAARVLPGRTHYAPSKLAIEAMTRNISAEVGPHGIRVNCIHPGLIDTPMIRWVLESPDILPQVVAQISLGRPGKPCDIGHAAAFLASDEARYITGQSIYVDGGWVGK